MFVGRFLARFVFRPLARRPARALAAFPLLFFAPGAGAQEGGSGDDPASFPELGLTLALPPLEELEAVPPGNAQVRAAWRGRLGGSRATISLTVLSAESFGFDEPEDVADVVLHHYESTAGSGSTFRATGRSLIAGELGWAPYACLFEGRWSAPGGEGDVESAHLSCGLLAEAGYALEARCEPPAGEKEAKVLRAFLETGITYGGPVRDAAWSDEEARERWLRDAPEATHEKLDDFIRTEHYIVLTNSSGGKAFAKKMEECYRTIRGVFPFDEVPGRRLMPVFLFRTPDEYYDYYVKIAGKTREQAEQSKGHAWRDYYATWYEAPNDPVHVHEATHQIFANRLRLNGGGSWFQEGVAEYVETRDNDRNVAARHVKKEEHTPLRELMSLASLLHSSKDDVRGGSKASDHYKLAALLIEFLRESKFGRERFQDFVHTIGRVRRGDLAAIERAIQSVYGVSIEELEAEWVKYCKKR